MALFIAATHHDTFPKVVYGAGKATVCVLIEGISRVWIDANAVRLADVLFPFIGVHECVLVGGDLLLAEVSGEFGAPVERPE